MKILLYKDLIVGFLSQNIEDKDLLKRVKNIFKNENLSFLYSKKSLSFLKNELGEEYEQEYNAFVTKVGDMGVNIPSLANSITFEEEFLNIYSNTKENDFWGLNVSDNKKWLITIQYNPVEAEKALLYEKNYQRFIS